jgi:hypothetical protein
MGRTLMDADELGDADDVVVVGYDFWKNKLLLLEAGAAERSA